MTVSTLGYICHAHLCEMQARESKGALGRHYTDKRGQVHLRPLRVMSRLLDIQDDYQQRYAASIAEGTPMPSVQL